MYSKRPITVNQLLSFDLKLLAAGAVHAWSSYGSSISFICILSSNEKLGLDDANIAVDVMQTIRYFCAL